MKTWIYIFTSVLGVVIFGSLVKYENNKKVSIGIFAAFEIGDAHVLSNYFYKNVKMSILDKKGIFNKKQAEIILDEFFDQNKISSFKTIKYREQKNFSTAICQIISKADVYYTVFITISNIGNNKAITQITIDAQSMMLD